MLSGAQPAGTGRLVEPMRPAVLAHVRNEVVHLGLADIGQ